MTEKIGYNRSWDDWKGEPLCQDCKKLVDSLVDAYYEGPEIDGYNPLEVAYNHAKAYDMLCGGKFCLSRRPPGGN